MAALQAARMGNGMWQYGDESRMMRLRRHHGIGYSTAMVSGYMNGTGAVRAPQLHTFARETAR